MNRITIRSMTGLGVGEVHENGVMCTVEIRAVNNRFLEISTRLPQSLNQHEQEMRDYVRSRIDRGKLYINIIIQQVNGNPLGLRVIPDKARSIRNLLTELKKETGVEEPLTLDHFLKFSEIFEPSENGKPDDHLWQQVKHALDQALENLNAMRLKEGSSLTDDLVQRIKQLGECVDAVERIAADNLRDKHQKMVERVGTLVDQYPLHEDRLYTEIAILSDRLDVTEECVRLKSHNQLFLETLGSDKPVGKKLTFLLQEMNREVNTISSKASSVEISHLVVEMKEEIEKLREQVQNLE